jgi:hypothetical protein
VASNSDRARRGAHPAAGLSLRRLAGHGVLAPDARA